MADSQRSNSPNAKATGLLVASGGFIPARFFLMSLYRRNEMSDRPKTADREFLLTEVDAYLEQLCNIGDVGGIFAAFGCLDPDPKRMTDEALWDVYQEFIQDDGK